MSRWRHRTTRESGERGASLPEYALLLAGMAVGVLYLMDRPERAVQRLRLCAEGLMIASSILFTSWVTIMPPALAASEGQPAVVRAHLLAFPIGDVVLLSVVVFAVTTVE